MFKRNFLIKLTVVGAFFLTFFGCAATSHQNFFYPQFSDVVKQYPHTNDPLSLQGITSTSVNSISALSVSPDVSIIVHPAYSVFFDDVVKEDYSESKYRLLRRQFENEARFISNQAQFGNIVVLILPADSLSNYESSLSYASYLNGISLKKNTIYYLFSESRSSGALPMENMVVLYQFLQAVKARKALIGGGYIGRCQKEFFDQFIKYFDNANTFIAPEISTISPKDISDDEASAILSGIRRQDYTPVRLFINKKVGGSANILSVPQQNDL